MGYVTFYTPDAGARWYQIADSQRDVPEISDTTRAAWAEIDPENGARAERYNQARANIENIPVLQRSLEASKNPPTLRVDVCLAVVRSLLTTIVGIIFIANVALLCVGVWFALLPVALGAFVLFYFPSGSIEEKLVEKLTPWVGEWPAKFITALTPLGWWYPTYYWINEMRKAKPAATAEEVANAELEIDNARSGLNGAIDALPEITDGLIDRLPQDARNELERVRGNWTLVDGESLRERIGDELIRARQSLQETGFFDFSKKASLENRIQSLERTQTRFEANERFQLYNAPPA